MGFFKRVFFEHGQLDPLKLWENTFNKLIDKELLTIEEVNEIVKKSLYE